MPVLLAGGEHDGIAPPTNMAAMHARIPGSQLQIFAGGHLFFAQDKTAYPFMIAWLKSHAEKK
jgi:pimeloyl-ACP methyl ester carboxylesterase